MTTALVPVKEYVSAETDFALFARLHRGEEPALACLFDRYSKLVYSTALRVLREPAAAEDITQQLFLQIWRRPPAVPAGGASLAGWFALIARNHAISELRKRRPTCSLDEFSLSSPCDCFKEVELNAMVARLRVFMNELPSEQRATLELAYFEGLTHEEIAARTGQPLGTVKSRIRKALKSLTDLCKRAQLVNASAQVAEIEGADCPPQPQLKIEAA